MLLFVSPCTADYICTRIIYEYDSLYRLTQAIYTESITATFQYGYDSVGNTEIITKTIGPETPVEECEFNKANQLIDSEDDLGTTEDKYNDNGKLEQILPPGATPGNPTSAIAYEYDQRNLMTGSKTNPTGSGWVDQAGYVYDGAGSRVQQLDYTGDPTITTTYINDILGLTQVLVADDGTNEVYNLFGLDLISQDSGGEIRGLLADGLGSVRTEMVVGDVEAVITYSPYGNPLEQTGTSDTTYGFTGEEYNDSTGLLYLRARYYSPYIYRLLTPDPIRITD